MKTDKDNLNNFYFVIPIVLIAIFFINLILINNRINNLEIKEIIRTYEKMIHQINTKKKIQTIPPKLEDITAPPKKQILIAENTKTIENSLQSNPIPILILCYNRPDYLEKTIENILKYLPINSNFFIVISQDGNDKGVEEMIENKLSKLIFKKTLFYHIQVKFFFFFLKNLNQKKHDKKEFIKNKTKSSIKFIGLLLHFTTL